MKIEQFHNKNQFLITDDDNNVYFQSYKSIIFIEIEEANYA